VPKQGEADAAEWIEITGSKQGVEEARDLILETVRNAASASGGGEKGVRDERWVGLGTLAPAK
jgi:hypothetical protein